MKLVELPIATADGEFTAHYSEKGLAELNFPKARGAAPRAVKPRVVPSQILRWHQATAVALKAMLAGRDAKKLPPLDWTGKTEFQQAVWRQMLAIPAGKTKSYGEIATALKNPRAVRAVGGACGANPVPVLVPCHRILAANRKIGGFSGGPDWKQDLLAREGILIPNKIEKRIVDAWHKAALNLGFKFTAPFVFKPKNGKGVECLGLVHNFGARIGTLISVGVGPSLQLHYPSFKEGFSESCLGLGYAKYKRKRWVEMLCDWGYWGPPSKWPNWYSPGPVCHLQYVNGVVSHTTA